MLGNLVRCVRFGRSIVVSMGDGFEMRIRIDVDH